MAEVILVIMAIYMTMVYGPIAEFLVELFPTQIRHTPMSLPYDISNVRPASVRAFFLAPR